MFFCSTNTIIQYSTTLIEQSFIESNTREVLLRCEYWPLMRSILPEKNKAILILTHYTFTSIQTFLNIPR